MRFWTVLVVLLGGVACTHATRVEQLKSDRFRITCSEAGLARCLAETASNVCDRRAYFIERGLSDVNRRGSSDTPVVAESSQAIVRCGPETGWGDEGKVLMSEAPVKAAEPKPRAGICAPGSTQPCVGTAGCAGGQACLADGSGFAPCDCGQPPSPPPVSPASPPAPVVAEPPPSP